MSILKLNESFLINFYALMTIKMKNMRRFCSETVRRKAVGMDISYMSPSNEYISSSLRPTVMATTGNIKRPGPEYRVAPVCLRSNVTAIQTRCWSCRGLGGEGGGR